MFRRHSMWLAAVLAFVAAGCQEVTSPERGLAPQALVMTGPLVVKQMATGGYHSCAVKTDDSLVCWGYGNYGQTTNPATLGTVKEVAAGDAHTCVIRSDDTVACWGYGLPGQTNVPATLGTVKQISARFWHSCAIRTDDMAVCWGYNNTGQTTIPADLGAIKQLSAGGNFTCAIKMDDMLVCWGFTGYGATTVPSGLGPVKHVATGENHTCAVKADDTLACWGLSVHGQIATPASLGTVKQAAAGSAHTCVIKSDDTVACWGQNSNGQVMVPPAIGTVKEIRSGQQHSCVIKTNDSVACWGYNIVGQANVPNAAAHHPPAASFTTPTSVETNSTFAISLDNAHVVTPGGIVSADDAGIEYAFDCGSGYGSFATAGATTCTAGAPGPQIVKGKLRDQDGDEQEYSAAVDIMPPSNQAPTALPGGPYSGSEGAVLALQLAGSDPDGDALTYEWDLGDGTAGSGATPPTTHAYANNGSYAIVLTVSDGKGGTDTRATIVTIANAAPGITAITSTAAPSPVGTSFDLTLSFADAGAGDTHAATIDWGNGTTTHADIESGFSTARVYTSAGVYRIEVTVTDSDGASDTSSYEYIVVYDPSAGFVTGGGWIRYEANACSEICAAAGRGDFGFVSKYQSGKSIPSGASRFQFHSAALLFESGQYEWLVVAGARAQFKGAGQINGAGDYGFLLTAIDGSLSGGDGLDRFRIKIWDRNTGVVVFDNQRGSDDAASDATALDKLNGNGSVVIHRK